MSRQSDMLCTMSIEIPTIEPAEVRAGDTVTWLKSLASYPASIWTLYYRLINATAKIDITASASGDAHLVSVPTTTSDDWTAGDYAYIAWVTDGTNRVTVAQGRMTVLPNLAAVTAAGYDSRTHAKKMLDAIDAALLSLSSGERLAVVEADIVSRKFKYDFNGLQRLRSIYAAEVRAEENSERIKLGLKPRNKLNVRFC